MKKTFKKIIGIMGIVILFVGCVIGEYFMIKQIDENHQSELAEEIYKDMGMNLYIIKDAATKGNTDKYEEILNYLNDDLYKLKTLPFVVARDTDKIFKLEKSMGVLNTKSIVVDEMAQMTKYSEAVISEIEDKYTEADDVDKDDLEEIKELMVSYQKKMPAIQSEEGKGMAAKLNAVFNAIRDGASDVSECYGVCYKDRMGELVEEFKEELKNTSSKVQDLNATILDDVLKIEFN